MPAQPVLDAGALGDEILAVIRQQPDLHRLLVQIRGREVLHAVLDDRSGDRERVDLIRLARLALTAPGGAHPMRRDADDPLAGRDQRLLKRPDTPRQSSIAHTRSSSRLARPAHRDQMPRLLGLDLPGAADPARALIDGRQRVCALVRVRPDHDHLHHPPRWSFDEADLRRTTVSWGDATLLSSHAEGPRAAAGDRSFCGSDNDDTEL